MFTEAEKVRIRHHLGYINVAQVQTFVLGAPAAVETSFLIEGAMNRVLVEAEAQARALVANCDGVEAQMAENQELLAVTQVDEIAIRPNEFEDLLKRYHYWRNALANVLGVVPNPFDKRFAAGGAGSINIRVVH